MKNTSKYPKSSEHDVSKWVFKNHEHKLKRKSMLLVKKLRIRESGTLNNPMYADKYFYNSKQMDEFKYLHL